MSVNERMCSGNLLIGEDKFGFYHLVNPVRECTSSNYSTTQWRFGDATAELFD